MQYVYILRSKKDGSRYIGTTADLKRRIREHNNGGARYSSTKCPYEIIWYAAFVDKLFAYDFERYLKSSSGSAFAKKHLV
jgi:putative endonuclease